MNKKLLIALGLVSVSFANAQVGINTDTPKATLDVVSHPTGQVLDGVIAPRITGANLRAKTYGSQQNGAIVYVTTADTSPAGQTVQVTSLGYYYFDATLPTTGQWVKMGMGAPGSFDKTDDEWINDPTNTMIKVGKNSDGTTARTAGTDVVVKDNGNVGIGTDNPLAKLHVKGVQARIEGLSSDASNTAYLGFRRSDVRTGYVGDGSGSNDNIYLQSDLGDVVLATTSTVTAANSAILQNATGNFGLGQPNPTTKLEINTATAGGGFKMTDTTQGLNKVLTSDANGVGTWQNVAGVVKINSTAVAAGEISVYSNTGSTQIAQINSGVILTSPDNTKWKITVNNDGSLNSQKVTVP